MLTIIKKLLKGSSSLMGSELDEFLGYIFPLPRSFFQLPVPEMDSVACNERTLFGKPAVLLEIQKKVSMTSGCRRALNLKINK